jgi:hypothetical protein
MAARVFNPSSNHPARAVQAWQILVSTAMNRQTLTYKLLAKLMYHRDAQGVLDKILGHIAFYCIDHDQPRLHRSLWDKAEAHPVMTFQWILQDGTRNGSAYMPTTGTTSIHRAPRSCRLRIFGTESRR